MRDLFVSHSSKDTLLANQIVAALEANGVSCWVAPRDVRTGAEYQAEILRGLRESNGVLFLHSRHATESRHVTREIALADETGKPIYPVKLTNDPISGSLEYTLASRQWIDFAANPDGALARIIADLPEQRALRVRTWNWNIPEEDRKKLGRRAMMGIVTFAALGAVIFFGFNFYRGYASLRECDLGAASEYELEPHAGAGVPFGMIDPATAIPACREAVMRNPSSGRAAYQLYRALSSNGYAEAAGAAKQSARALGHLEAVLIEPINQNNSDPAAENFDPAAEPTLSPEGTAAYQHVAAAARNDPRAMALLAKSLLAFRYGVTPRIGESLVALLQPWQPEEALSAARRGEYGLQAVDAVANSTDSIPDGAHRYLVTAVAYRLRQQAADMQFAPALHEIDIRASAALGYAPSRYAQAAADYAQEQAVGQSNIATLAASMQTLAEEGYRPAMIFMAKLHMGIEGHPIDYLEAQRWLDRAGPIVVGEEP
ncbi:MAG: toll/interleukin-1 receptor domain-containing protein [Caulobacterales bacterium]|jgi:hypothetical protein|nr:toll/interleukin-1 receptor domain-containing protein [Caulobacterales bacterium]